MKSVVYNWLCRRSVLFSEMSGEDFTNFEVILSHIVIVLFILLLGILGHFDYVSGGGL